MNKALFIGQYPNDIEPYLRSFFQTLIHSIADLGIDCTVIAPVSITHYKDKIFSIPFQTRDTTLKGNHINVYHPRYVSYSSKRIGKINTGYYSEKAFQKSAIRCAKNLKDNYDFVYGHFFLTGGLAAVRIGQLFKKPSFIAYGECDYQSQILNDYGDIKSCDVEGLSGIVSVSTQNTNELIQLALVPGVPILTAPNATDLSLFYKKDKKECRKMLGLPQNKFIVGFVGGFIERKGDKRLLAAVNQIDGAYVAFAGKGDNPPSGDKVVFCKPLEHERVCDFLNAIDVFCLPTLSEGSCNAIIEAMACGVPIVSSNLPFNDDVLDNSNSIRVDPTSIQDIRKAIEQLLNSPKKREDLSQKSLKKSQEFGIEIRAKKILDFIISISTRKDDSYR